jgi:hypothetical protein
MRTLIICAALALSACATAPQQAPATFGGKAAGLPVIAVASLATVGDADALTAAPLTALELLNLNIAADVRSGRMTVTEAKIAAEKADAARASLAIAIDEIDRGNKAVGLMAIAEANRLIVEGNSARAPRIYLR